MSTTPSIILSVTPRPGGAALAGTRGLDRKFYDDGKGGYSVEAMIRRLVLPAFTSLEGVLDGFVMLHLAHGYEEADDPAGQKRFALQGPAWCEQRSDMAWAWRGFADAVNRLLTNDQRGRLIFYTGSPGTMPAVNAPGAGRLFRRSLDQYMNADETGVMMDRAGSFENDDQNHWRFEVIDRWQTEGRFVAVEGGDATSTPKISLWSDIAWMTESRWLESKMERITEQVGIGRCCIALCQTWDGKLDRDRQAAEIRRARELGMVVCLPHADLDDMAAKGLTLAGMLREEVGA